ncbi:hypothetical protein [Streptomyces fagopyri]|uniref:hypothetical protein n=1 Tax=Streptomyces fagopyri TaxID=2662397 RepID=UPI0037113366
MFLIDTRLGGEVEACSAGVTCTGHTGVRVVAGLAPEFFVADLGGIQKFRAALGDGKFAPDVFLGGENHFGNRNACPGP